MKNPNQKYMAIEQYSELLAYLERNNIKVVRLLGGEPTIHPKFKEIIKLTTERNLAIELFTNGIFPKKMDNFLISQKSNIRAYHFNIASPGYQMKSVRKKTNEFIHQARYHSDVVLEVTMDSLSTDYRELILRVGTDVLPFCSIRIGIAGVFTWENGFSLKKNRFIGKNILNISTTLLHKYKAKSIFLSELTPCMFNNRQLEYIKTNKYFQSVGYGCEGRVGIFELTTDLKAIACYGLSSLGEVSIIKDRQVDTDPHSIKKIYDKLRNLRIRYSKKIIPLECRICKYYGYGKGQCPGPCLITKPL